MVNRIVLTINSTPINFGILAFTISNASLGYSKYITKTFVTGIPFLNNQVLIHPTTFNFTMNNLLARLQDFDTDGNLIFSLHSGIGGMNNIIHIDFNTPGEYAVTPVYVPSYITVGTETVTIDPDATLNPLNFKDLSIEIIDTYENELPLIVEFTEASSPKLSFDSGDDLINSFMTSKLTFNMLVTDGVDAHFKHLYTGDEKRYLVRLIGIDIDENEELIWQGYLLPDQYNEPYKGGPYFVEFTAIDMLANLKNRFFKPWFYQQKFTIIEFIALCLQNTGLNQNILVAPSVLPTNLQFGFKDLNFSLKQYIGSGKFTDLNAILTDVLESNLLTIYSYRGFWHLVGFHQKRNETIVYEQYNTDGVRIENVVVNKKVKRYLNLQDSVNLGVVSPYKTVTVDFNAKGTKNLFSDAVIEVPANDLYSTYFKQEGSYTQTASAYPYPIPSLHYYTTDFKDWLVNFVNPKIFYRKNRERFFALSFINMNNYNVTEAAALNNYFECTEKPYVEAGINYEFQIEFEITCNSSFFGLSFLDKVKNNELDRAVCYQLFLNDIETLSNRPSFDAVSNLAYDVETTLEGLIKVKVKFSKSLDYTFAASGIVKFRILVPILKNSTDKFILEKLTFKKLKLNIIEDYVDTQNIEAVRPLNFTTKLDYKAAFTSALDVSIENNIGFGRPISSQYFYTIDRTFAPTLFNDLHLFPPALALPLQFSMFTSSNTIYKDIFVEGYKNALFLEDTLTDAQSEFKSVYGNLLPSENSKIGFLKSFTGRPKLPKGYRATAAIPSTSNLKYMKVSYAVENVSLRAKWSINGNFTVYDNFNKTIAKVLHNLYSRESYLQETTVLDLVFPDTIVLFQFDGGNRKFIPTRLELDLFAGKTRITASEDVYDVVTDITYL